PNVRVVTAIGRSCHLHGPGRSRSRGRNRGCEPTDHYGMITRMRRLGVDIGGVIIEPADGDADTSFFGAHYLRTPVVHGAFDALAALGPAFDEVHLVSKCG